MLLYFFLFQAEDGIRDLVRSRGLGDVYKRQLDDSAVEFGITDADTRDRLGETACTWIELADLESESVSCLLYTSDAADERSSVDLGGRRIIKKKNKYYFKKHRAQLHRCSCETK